MASASCSSLRTAPNCSRPSTSGSSSMNRSPTHTSTPSTASTRSSANAASPSWRSATRSATVHCSTGGRGRYNEPISRSRYHTAKRGRQAVQVVKSVDARNYDLTVFKVKWGDLTLKIYDKGGCVLRIEVVAHNVKDLRSGKVLDKLPDLLKRMREMLVRFLGTVQAAHVAFLDEGAFERWSKPTQRGTRRLAGIDLNKARNRHVVDAVVGLSTRPGG